MKITDLRFAFVGGDTYAVYFKTVAPDDLGGLQTSCAVEFTIDSEQVCSSKLLEKGVALAKSHAWKRKSVLHANARIMEQRRDFDFEV
jgi:hypothetical protein